MHSRDLPDDVQIHISIVMRYDITHAAHFSKGEFRNGPAGCLGEVRRGLADDFDAPYHRVLLLLVGVEIGLRGVFDV